MRITISSVREHREGVHNVRWVERVRAVHKRTPPSHASHNDRLQRINLVPRHRRAPWISDRSQVARLDLLEAFLALEEDGVAARLLRAERAAEFAALCVEEQTGGARQTVHRDAVAAVEAERVGARRKLRRVEADLDPVVDKLVAEQLGAVDAVILAQLVDPVPAAAPRVAANLPQRAQDLREPTAGHLEVQAFLLADAAVIGEEMDKGRLVLEGA